MQIVVEMPDGTLSIATDKAVEEEHAAARREAAALAADEAAAAAAAAAREDRGSEAEDDRARAAIAALIREMRQDQPVFDVDIELLAQIYQHQRRVRTLGMLLCLDCFHVGVTMAIAPRLSAFSFSSLFVGLLADLVGFSAISKNSASLTTLFLFFAAISLVFQASFVLIQPIIIIKLIEVVIAVQVRQGYIQMERLENLERSLAELEDGRVELGGRIVAGRRGQGDEGEEE